jgi:DNA polymerase-3 subunit gamma/tau
MIDEYSKNLDMQDIGLFWQLTIKTIDDLRIIGDENLALEMYIIQLSHLKRFDENKEQNQSTETQINYKNDSINKTKSEKNLEKTETNKTKNQLKSTNQIKTNPMKSFSQEKSKNNFEITNFGDLINLANKEKEIELKYDLERNVKLVSFNKGKIDISFSDKLNQNFIKNLTEKLLKWTGERWIISLSRNADAKSLFEKNLESKNTQLEDFKNSSIAREIESAFPDAELIDIKEED